MVTNKYNTDELLQLGLETGADLLKADFPPERYWLPHFLPKSSIVLMGGQAKIGKSWLVGNMTRSLTLGEPFLENEPGYRQLGSNDPRWSTPIPSRAARVLVIDKEVGRRSLKGRLGSIYESDYASNPTSTDRLIREHLFINSKDSGGDDYVPPSFSSNEGEDKLQMLCEAVCPEVLILDPIGKMHHYDENSAGQIQSLYDRLERIQNLLKKFETTILIVHHFGKPARQIPGGTNADPLDQYNFRGSSKWFDLPDGLITCARLQPNQSANSTKPVGQRGWDIQMQIKPRHDEELPRLVLGVNQLGDKRIYFRRTL
jgi:hypothetical protein